MCRNWLKLDFVNALMQLNSIVILAQRIWLQMSIFAPYLIHRYLSGDVTLLFILITVLLCCIKMANYGTTPYSLIFIPTAALLLAVRRANTEPFQNQLVETKNQLVQMRNRLGLLLVLAQFYLKVCAVSWHIHFRAQIWKTQLFIVVVLSSPIENFSFFVLWKVLRCIVVTNYFCVPAGISTLMSNSDQLGPYIFCQKLKKVQPSRE